MNKTIFISLAINFFLTSVVHPQVSVIGDLVRERVSNIGETYDGVIYVRNFSDEARDARVYQTDYLCFSDGSVIYGEPAGQDPRSNAAWITYNPHYLTVPPKEVSEVHYTITVPADANLTGSYWSMFMVEGVSLEPPSAVTDETGQNVLSIRHVIRYAIQMVTHIGESGTRAISFLNTELLKEEGTRILQVDIENTGERFMKLIVWSELYNDEGGFIGRFEGGERRLYPGTSVRYEIDLSEVPEGTYQALVVADGGGDDIFGINYTMKF